MRQISHIIPIAQSNAEAVSMQSALHQDGMAISSLNGDAVPR